VQLAKSYGARVTAVVATRDPDLVKALGADRAVDYTAQDFTQINETFDYVVVVEVAWRVLDVIASFFFPLAGV